MLYKDEKFRYNCLKKLIRNTIVFENMYILLPDIKTRTRYDLKYNYDIFNVCSLDEYTSGSCEVLTKEELADMIE